MSVNGHFVALARAGGPWAASDRAALAGAVVVAAITLIALAGPSLLAHDPLRQDLLALNAPPSAEHWLGTDSLGRDVLARLVAGARTTLLIGAGGAAFAFIAGAGVGLAALALGGTAPLIVYGAVDLIRVLPGMLLVLLLIVAMGSGALAVTVAVGLTFAPLVAYVARAAWRREAQQDYVAAAVSFGYGRLYILTRHVAPNIAGAMVTQAAIVLPRCVVTESVVSFLGLGATPDQPTWGRMISDAARFAERAPHAVLGPLAALVALTLALSLIGDRLRIRLDPLRRADAEPGR